MHVSDRLLSAAARRVRGARAPCRSSLLDASIVVVVAIFLVLHASLRRAGGSPGSIFLALPAALVGGMLAAFAGDRVMSLGSLVGFITVLGIAARNGIMLFQHSGISSGSRASRSARPRAARRERATVADPDDDAVHRGWHCCRCVIPGSIPGHEIEHPMAVVILGGLVTSTLLVLFVLPALYLRAGAKLTPAVRARHAAAM